jgi:hypothetical protein
MMHGPIRNDNGLYFEIHRFIILELLRIHVILFLLRYIN